MSKLLQAKGGQKYVYLCAVGHNLQICASRKIIGDFFFGELFGRTPLNTLSASMPLAEMLAHLNLTSLHPLVD